MSKKKITRIIGAIVVLVVIVGGGYKFAVHRKNKIPKDSLVLALSSMPSTINPIYANNSSEMLVSDILYEPLYTFNNKGEIDYDGLASNVTVSDNNMIYTVTLKKDLKWSDGKAITANDVVFTFNKMMESKDKSLLASKFIMDNKAVTVEKVNDQVVRFMLPESSIDFEENIGKIDTIPEHAYEDSNKLNKNTVNDGPYVFESENSKQIILAKNDNFNGDKPKINNVVFKILPTEGSVTAALESNELSAAISSEKIAANPRVNLNYNINTTNSGTVNELVFNMKNENLNNLKVREAISYALNKKELLEIQYGQSQYAKLGNSTFAPNSQYYTSDIAAYNYNMEKAKTIMKTVGTKNITLTLMYQSGITWMQNQAINIKNSLAQIGIDVQLKPLGKELFDKQLEIKNNTTYDLALTSYNINNSTNGYSDVFATNGKFNYSNFSNLQIDNLFNLAKSANSITERNQIYTEIQQKLAEEIPSYVISYPNDIILTTNSLQGVTDKDISSEYIFDNWEEIYFKN